MNKPDTWYMQKGAEIAIDWSAEPFGSQVMISCKDLEGSHPVWNLPETWQDALAAQLVRDYSKISPNDRLCYADDVMETIRYVVDKLHSR